MAAPILSIPLYQLLTGIAALGVGKGVQQTFENLDEDQLEQRFTDTFKRLLLGPSVSPSIISTPSGEVYAPDEPTPAEPDILATYPESTDQPWIMSTPMPEGEPKGIPGLPIPETQDKLKGIPGLPVPEIQDKLRGFQTPILPNFNVLNKKLNELPENKIDKFLEKQDSLYDDDYEIFLSDDKKKIEQGIIPENKKYTFDDLIERYGEYEPIHKYWEQEWSGNVGNLGSRLAGEIMRSGGMYQTESGLTAPSYYEDYKFKLQDLARKELGKDFIGYRLMVKAEMDDLLNEGDAAFDVKSYSLKKKSALGFKHFTNEAFIDMETGEPRADLVLAEAPLDVEGLVMRGKSSESEIVYDNQFVNPEQMNFYDLNGKLIKGAQSGFLTEDKKESTTVNIPKQDLSVEDIQKQIQFKKSKFVNTYDFIYNGKIVGQIEKRKEKFKGLNEYDLIDTKIEDNTPVDIKLGFNDAKSSMLKGLTNRIKNKELDLDNYKLVEDYYGDIEKTKKEISSNPVGSLIDKPLSNE